MYKGIINTKTNTKELEYNKHGLLRYIRQCLESLEELSHASIFRSGDLGSIHMLPLSPCQVIMSSEPDT
jgi:hypothetical protein